jgi:hypothetical protein
VYDVTKLRTQVECRSVMQRALSRNEPEVYRQVFRRLCQLAGFENDNPDDPLLREFYETLAAYEQLLTERNGRTTVAAAFSLYRIAEIGRPMTGRYWRCARWSIGRSANVQSTASRGGRMVE